jgi:hypothetical protein
MLVFILGGLSDAELELNYIATRTVHPGIEAMEFRQVSLKQAEAEI